MEIGKRKEIIWLVRILELKIRKSNNFLFLNLRQNGIPLIRNSYHTYMVVYSLTLNSSFKETLNLGLRILQFKSLILTCHMTSDFHCF